MIFLFRFELVLIPSKYQEKNERLDFWNVIFYITIIGLNRPLENMSELHLSFTEENYLKALVQLTVVDTEKAEVGTNEIAHHLLVKPATVNDMLKKLKEKGLVDYEKYGKITLTKAGQLAGMYILRKHRLWETFLAEKLDFTWDEVHEIAEQLEHIHSTKLVDRIDAFLGFPKFDPHGDAIPDKDGNITIPIRKLLNDVPEKQVCQVVGVKDNSTSFLQYADKIGIALGAMIEIKEREEYDGQTILLTQKGEFTVSSKFTANIYVLMNA